MGIRIGIGSLKIGQGSTGVDWSSYWATRFPSALLAVPYSSTRIDLGWTNNGDTDYDYVSIEGSTDGVNYTEYDTATTGDAAANITGLTEATDYYFRIRYVKGTSASDYTDAVESYTLPAALTDGHTLLWIPYEDSSLYTLDGANVIEVTDKLASGRKFVGGAVKPTLTANGMYFGALADLAATFNFSGVNTIYLVMALHEWRQDNSLMRLTGGDGLTQGNANNSYKYRNGSAGYTLVQTGLALDTYGVFKMGCNAPSLTGFFQIDSLTAHVNYSGVSDLTGIRFYSTGTPDNRPKWTIKEIIVRDQYEYGTATLTKIGNYLAKKKS